MGKNGGRRPGAGRPKGSPNKVTKHFKEAVTAFLDDNQAQFQAILDEIRYGIKDENGKYIIKPDPARAFDVMTKVAEYAHPKLARTEHTGKDGEDLLPQGIRIQL